MQASKAILSGGAKRVLMTADTIGGVWTFAMELCRGLAERGVEVILATFGTRPSNWQLEQARDIPNLALHPSGFRLEWMDDPWSDLSRATEWVLQLESRYSPDVVHLNSFGIATRRWRAPVVLTAHSCVASWWNAVKAEPIPSNWSLYFNQVRKCLACADRVAAPTRAFLEGLSQAYNANGLLMRASVIPNGARKRGDSTSDKEPIILAAGRLWDESKNIGVLNEAAAKAPWPVYLAGESCSPDGRSLAFPECRVLGSLPRKELMVHYKRAAIFAHPSVYEPFGLSVLEAAVSGCALVLSDIPTLRELWDEAAVFVAPRSADAWASALGEVAGSPEMRRDLIQKSTARAREYTAQRMTSDYLSLYGMAQRRHTACAS